MDDRIGKLEAHVGHLQEDVRRIVHKIDALAEKLDAFKGAVAAKFGVVSEKFEALRSELAAFQLQTKGSFAELRLEMKRERWMDRVWWLTISGALLAVMARGFKWI